MTSAAESTALPDGRRLGYREFGDRGGRPCVHVPGTPASGLIGQVYDRAARRAGVRWVSVDKPGFGASDADPDRSLPRHAADLARLADHLGLARFAVAGESGGGPAALAAAHQLGDRLSTCLVLCGMGPPHAHDDGDGMKAANRRMFALARHDPEALRRQMGQLARLLADPDGAREWERALRDGMPEADRRAWERFESSWLLPAAQDALRDGGRGAAQELAVLVRPWGFALGEISCPVELWHGTADENVPVEVARRVAAEIPGCRAHVVAGEGHCLAAVRQEEIMDAVLRTD